MQRHWLISKGIHNQTELAAILGRGEVTKKLRVKAHRIWHGTIPSDEDMKIIFDGTHARVTPNDFYGLSKKQKHKSKHKRSN